jgi:hypothetical protein
MKNLQAQVVMKKLAEAKIADRVDLSLDSRGCF